ncbi:hypothetical protein BDD12DRAFT_820598 [Trichophaea hybrida]|nr:hypothetical protein BDD12DRAFT_820598 [Trichophaea hybrida]
MATAYAPYSSAMRLGQGFNSYTQNTCIDSAVVFEPIRSGPPPPPVESESQRQIVTYSTQFVDKLSDVVEATNLSPSTSIKSGSIGNSGKGGGGFIDCDKFKEADINFLIYVKAISQPPSPPQQENMRFQRVKNLPQESFNRIFGDCFISGFLEGGEFTVLVSISIAKEVKEKEGEAAVRTQARIALTALTGREEADAAILAARKMLAEKTEMTLNVNWSGGGRLKDEDTVWDIDTILRVAARFPDLVYKCPQRIAAVLSKYTSLRSFHEQMPGIVPLDYDNVVLYHTYLLEAYMEYKHIVKQLNLMLEDPSHYQEAPELPEETREDIKPIRLIHSELDDAKTYCRNQMLRIVKEVDNVAVHPELASSEDHVPPFMSSELFAAMIPVRIRAGKKAEVGGKEY